MFVSAHRRIRILEKIDALDNEQLVKLSKRRKKTVQKEEFASASSSEEPTDELRTQQQPVEKPLLYARIENVVEPQFVTDNWMKVFLF